MKTPYPPRNPPAPRRFRGTSPWHASDHHWPETQLQGGRSLCRTESHQTPLTRDGRKPRIGRTTPQAGWRKRQPIPPRELLESCGSPGIPSFSSPLLSSQASVIRTSTRGTRRKHPHNAFRARHRTVRQGTPRASNECALDACQRRPTPHSTTRGKEGGEPSTQRSASRCRDEVLGTGENKCRMHTILNALGSGGGEGPAGGDSGNYGAGPRLGRGRERTCCGPWLGRGGGVGGRGGGGTPRRRESNERGSPSLSRWVQDDELLAHASPRLDQSPGVPLAPTHRTPRPDSDHMAKKAAATHASTRPRVRPNSFWRTTRGPMMHRSASMIKAIRKEGDPLSRPRTGNPANQGMRGGGKGCYEAPPERRSQKQLVRWSVLRVGPLPSACRQS